MQSAPAASVTLVTGGRTHVLFHGDVIGRHPGAALHLANPWVSEFHALVSVRAQQVCLLALRTGFKLDDTACDLAPLTIGSRVELVKGVLLEVVAVQEPVQVLTLGVGAAMDADVHGVVSLVGTPPVLKGGWVDDALCHVFPNGSSWFCTLKDTTFQLEHGQTWTAAGVPLRAAFRQVGLATTHMDTLDRVSLRLRSNYDSIVFEVDGRLPVVLSGLSARLVGELIDCGGTASWAAVARTLWRGLPLDVLRRRWDVQLVRLRRWLRAQTIRDDLVQMTGSGWVALVLEAGDEATDAG